MSEKLSKNYVDDSNDIRYDIMNYIICKQINDYLCSEPDEESITSKRLRIERHIMAIPSSNPSLPTAVS